MTTSKSVEEQWAEFKTQYGKSYSGAEEQQRFTIFKESVKNIVEHNKKYDAGEVTYKKGINHFADLTPEEFKKYAGGLKPQKN